MARIKSGILGKFTGSINGITGYNLGGQHVIRAKAVNVDNPKTPGQQAQRNNLKFATQVYQTLKPLLVLSLRQRDKKQSVLSEFLRLNLNKSIVNSELDFDKLIIFKPNTSASAIALEFDPHIDNLINGSNLGS
jgi:hypothetical protein